MQGRLLIIKRQCKKHTTHNDEGATVTEIHHCPWILEPENDPNSLGTPLTDAQIPKKWITHDDYPIDGADNQEANDSFEDFLLWLLNQDRFRGTEEWNQWGMIASEFKKTGEPGREWTESFEVVIVRRKKQEVSGEADFFL